MKSYLHENFSPNSTMASNELLKIAVAELQDKRTMSAKGSTTTHFDSLFEFDHFDGFFLRLI